MFRPLPHSRIAIAVAVALICGQAWAQPFPPDQEAAIVKIVEDGMAAQRQPGLNVGIWIPGRGEFVRAFGVGDIATKTPMAVNDHIRIASITKTFVAVTTLRLVDQGKLKLDDSLATWIEGIPNGDRITIRQLLGMRSGIFDFTSDEKFLADFTADPLMAFSPEDVVAIVKRHEPDFVPGEKVSYCDTNYIFLGMIIEKVTGRPVEDVIRDEIIVPLKLAETSFPTTPAMPEPYARGYYAGEDGKGEIRDYTATNPAVAWTAGAMISTLGDLKRLGEGARHRRTAQAGNARRAVDLRGDSGRQDQHRLRTRHRRFRRAGRPQRCDLRLHHGDVLRAGSRRHDRHRGHPRLELLELNHRDRPCARQAPDAGSGRVAGGGAAPPPVSRSATTRTRPRRRGRRSARGRRSCGRS